LPVATHGHDPSQRKENILLEMNSLKLMNSGGELPLTCDCVSPPRNPPSEQLAGIGLKSRVENRRNCRVNPSYFYFNILFGKMGDVYFERENVRDLRNVNVKRGGGDSNTYCVQVC
jgi:hypothetical protein